MAKRPTGKSYGAEGENDTAKSMTRATAAALGKATPLSSREGLKMQVVLAGQMASSRERPTSKGLPCKALPAATSVEEFQNLFASEQGRTNERKAC